MELRGGRSILYEHIHHGRKLCAAQGASRVSVGTCAVWRRLLRIILGTKLRHSTGSWHFLFPYLRISSCSAWMNLFVLISHFGYLIFFSLIPPVFWFFVCLFGWLNFLPCCFVLSPRGPEFTLAWALVSSWYRKLKTRGHCFLIFNGTGAAKIDILLLFYFGSHKFLHSHFHRQCFQRLKTPIFNAYISNLRNLIYALHFNHSLHMPSVFNEYGCKLRVHHLLHLNPFVSVPLLDMLLSCGMWSGRLVSGSPNTRTWSVRLPFPTNTVRSWWGEIVLETSYFIFGRIFEICVGLTDAEVCNISFRGVFSKHSISCSLLPWKFHLRQGHGVPAAGSWMVPCAFPNMCDTKAYWHQIRTMSATCC